MFIHLNKKITVPNCPRVRSIAWSNNHEFIACGGENGIIKVIKLEGSRGGSAKAKGDPAKNLSLNQTLEGHKSTVQNVCWNDNFQKLTSSDASGSIIVWMFYKGMWYEEMVNNRNKSLVSGMAWTHDGQKICIVYEDGAIITGSVDGNRIWGKEIKNASLSKVEWSPDGKIILIGTRDLEIQIFDYMGTFVKKMPLTTIQSLYNRTANFNTIPNLVCIKWFKNSPHDRPLIVAFEDGRIQLMKNENDDIPIIINTELKVSSVEWNFTGDMFAVTGSYEVNEGSNKNYLKLYNSEGELLVMVKVPGNELFDCCWEQSGLRLALAVDSYIFFATVKPSYHWGYLTNSIVFLTDCFRDKSKKLIFWEMVSNRRFEKKVNNFCQLATWNYSCSVVARLENQASAGDDSRPSTGTSGVDLHSLTLYNSIGTLIDYHLINLRVKHCCMNSSRLMVTSEDSFYVWNFKQLHNYSSVKKAYADQLYSELALGAESDDLDGIGQESPILITHSDPISCITASEKYFVVGHESGAINQFLFPNAIHVHKIMINCIPCRLALNRNSSRLALIDRSAKLYFYDFDASNEDSTSEGRLLDLHYTDIWDVKWATDHADLVAVLEKNKLYVVNVTRSEENGESTPSHGYICQFVKLCVKTITLDNLIVDTLQNKVSKVRDYVDTIESQYVRDLRDIMQQSLTDAVNYALQMPALPFLWGIIGEESLNCLNTETAMLAMVKNKDYQGIQFVKRLNKVQDSALKRAEVYAYLHKFEDAENIYLDVDRSDLALNMNKVIGNYQRVLEILEHHHVPNFEKELEQANYNLGEWYADNYEWSKAVNHFEKANAHDQLVPCYIARENYNGLILLIDKVSDPALLLDIGKYLESLGLCKECVKAYVKASKHEMAINACVSMAEWKMALDLAHQFQIADIDKLLEKYVEHLIADQKYLEIIEVYRKANKINEAISMIMRLIGELKRNNRGDAMLYKKLYVLIGVVYEESKAKGKVSKRSTLNDLLSAEEMLGGGQETRFIDDPWKGAEAYHFLLLSQRHLYQGYFDLAMKAALHLQDYEEYVSCEEIYSMIALTSYANKCYDICSKAFIKLEALNSGQHWNTWSSLQDSSGQIDDWRPSSEVPEERRVLYEMLAVRIFSSNPPNESKVTAGLTPKLDCKFCGETIADHNTSCPKCHTKFPACVATGKPIMDPRQQWLCKQCAHTAIKHEVSSFNNCPLCHFKIE